VRWARVIPSERSESRDLHLRPECGSLDSALRAPLGMTGSESAARSLGPTGTSRPARRSGGAQISIRCIRPSSTVYDSAPTSPAIETKTSTHSNEPVSRRM
jgi:hypothetical protein